MTKKNGPGDPGNPNKQKPPYSNSSSSQRARILRHFLVCPRLSTIQAREQYGIMSPASRVLELRTQGYQIDTCWISEADANGVLHRVGSYVYKGKNRGNHGK